MSQTSVKMRQDKACAGLLSDAQPNKVRTLAAEAGRIPFGYGVVLGTDKTEQCKLPTANTQKFAGVAVATLATESVAGSTAPGYAQYDAVNVLVEGAIWVVLKAADAAAVEDALYMLPSGGDAGKFTVVSTSNIATPLKVRRIYNDGTTLMAEVVTTTIAG